MTDIRKNLIVIIFLLGMTVVALLFLNLNKSWRSGPALITESQNEKSANLPKKISRGPVNFFNLSNSSGKILFYDESDSIIYESDYDGGNKKEIARIPGVSGISFGPDGKKIITSVIEEGSLKKFYFDLEKNLKVALDPNIKNSSFSPDGTKITYYFYDSRLAESNISISNPDGSDFKNIFKTRLKDVEVLWPEDDLIVFYSKAEQNQPAFSVSADGKNLRKLSEEETASYYEKYSAQKEFLENLGITALKIKVSQLENHIVFVNAKDGKLYSLGL